MNFLHRFVVRLLGHNPGDYTTAKEVSERLDALSNFQPSLQETRAYGAWRATNPRPPTPDDPYPWRKLIKAAPAGRAIFQFTDDEIGRDAFFRLQCKYGDSDIEINKGIVARVLDASKEFGVPLPVKVQADGSQVAVLRVISEDDGFIVSAKTPPGSGLPLHPGDFVMWVPIVHSQLVAAQSVDPRFGWVGLIRAKIKTEGPPFEIACRYG